MTSFLGVWTRDVQSENALALMHAAKSALQELSLPSIIVLDNAIVCGRGARPVENRRTSKSLGVVSSERAHETASVLSVHNQHETLSFPSTIIFNTSGLSQDRDVSISFDSTDSAHEFSISRDGFGLMPVFYFDNGQSVWFSSGIQPLIMVLKKTGVLNFEISDDGFFAYACFSYVPAPYTPVRNIHQLAPGETLVWSGYSDTSSPLMSCDAGTSKLPRDAAESERTNDALAPRRTRANSIDQAVKELDSLLQNAVASFAADLSNEPVGILLSGGLDSAACAALLVKAGIRVKAYTLDFGKFGVSELQYAELVANSLKIPLSVISASPNAVTSAMNKATVALDMPFGDGAAVLLHLLTSRAAQEVATVFNGEGGDQVFAGWANKPIIAASVYSNEMSLTDEYIRTLHRLYALDAFSDTTIVNEALIKSIVACEVENTAAPGLLHKLRRAGLALKGGQNIQPRANNIARSLGVNLRSIYTYPALVDWSFTVDPQFFLQGAHEKFLFKKAVEHLLPAEIVWREKRGMGVPLTDWCLGPMLKEVHRWLNPRALRADGRVHSNLPYLIANGLLSGHVRGRRIGELLWLLVMWQRWKYASGCEIPSEVFNPLWLWKAPWTAD